MLSNMNFYEHGYLDIHHLLNNFLILADDLSIYTLLPILIYSRSKQRTCVILNQNVSRSITFVQAIIVYFRSISCQGIQTRIPYSIFHQENIKRDSLKIILLFLYTHYFELKSFLNHHCDPNRFQDNLIILILMCNGKSSLLLINSSLPQLDWNQPV